MSNNGLAKYTRLSPAVSLLSQSHLNLPPFPSYARCCYTKRSQSATTPSTYQFTLLSFLVQTLRSQSTHEALGHFSDLRFTASFPCSETCAASGGPCFFDKADSVGTNTLTPLGMHLTSCSTQRFPPSKSENIRNKTSYQCIVAVSLTRETPFLGQDMMSMERVMPWLVAEVPLSRLSGRYRGP